MIRFKKDDGSNYPEWIEKKLGDIGSVAMCRRIFKEQTSDVGDVPFYKIGTFGGEPDAYISRELFEEYKEKYPFPEKGELLLSASGSIGRIVEYDGQDAYFQDSNIVWLNHDNEVINGFLKIFYTNVKWSGLEGSTIKRLYNKNILETKIKLPCLEEQQKIANFLSSVDDVIIASEQEVAALEEQKKGAMQKIFSQEVRFKADDGSDYPEWEEKKLGDVCSYRRGSFPQPYGLDKWYDDENGKPFIQVADVGDDMKLNPITKRHISKLAESQSVFVKKGTLLITLQGTIGRVAITDYDAFVDRTLLIIQNIDDCLDIKYLKIALHLLFDIEKRKADGGTIKTITKETLTNFTFKVPCLEEQKKIADFLSDIDTAIDLAKQELEQWKELKKGLLQQLFE